MNFEEAIKTKRIYLDGAMGSRLIALGLDSGRADALNIENPQAITEIHRSYVAVGSNCVYTNTFSANSLKQKEYPLEQIIFSAVNNAKNSGAEYVGYDCGPLGALLYPYGELSVDDAYRLFAEQAKIVANTKVDFVAIETMSDTLELKCAIRAFKDFCNLPIIATMSFEKTGRTFVGDTPQAFVLIAEGLGVNALGINCGTGAREAFDNIREIAKTTSLPIVAKLNAGMPTFKEGKTQYDTTPQEFGKEVKRLAMLGATIIGGCCGTNPEYIQAAIKNTIDLPFFLPKNNIDAVCSGRCVMPLIKGIKVGERLNPTGKPLLKKAIIEDDFDYILGVCASQCREGADILDINAGVAGVDEREKLPEIVSRIQSITDRPLQLDSSNPLALEKALERVDGIPIINSINGEEKVMSNILPLAKKYGAYIVALCLDENGIPDTVEGRLKIAEKIAKNVENTGISTDKLIFDALTLAVSVDKNNPQITLQTLQALNKKGYKTTLGLSNISFGLPARNIINDTFYALAKEKGLTMAILNPAMPTASAEERKFAENVLSGVDEGAKKYIEKFCGYTLPQKPIADLSVNECIVRGLKEEGVQGVKKLFAALDYKDILENYVIKGLDEVGELYEKGQAFLPQLMAGAESAKSILDCLKNHFLKESDNKGEIILFATVKGDVHDIGKNIVKAVMSNYGYRIIDLGKNVSTDNILQNIEKYAPSGIGLSALMTTSLLSMEETVKAVKEKYPHMAIVVGGAVVTPDFAKSIGAAYSKDANNCVKVFGELLK